MKITHCHAANLCAALRSSATGDVVRRPQLPHVTGAWVARWIERERVALRLGQVNEQLGLPLGGLGGLASLGGPPVRAQNHNIHFD